MNLLKKWRKNDHDETRALSKRGPDDGIIRFRNAMDNAFDRMWREFDVAPFAGMSDMWPAIDTSHDEKGLTLRVDVPGMKPEDLDVEVSGRQIAIRGRRDDKFSDKKKGYHRRERRTGSFVRSMTLPDYVDAEKIDAKYEHGCLTIAIPNAPGKGPKRIEVKA